MKYGNYSLGFDIGVSSIGWAMIDFEKSKIIRLGVRKFDQPIVPKTGASLTEARRGKRALRRNIRRKSFRKKQQLRNMVSEGLLSDAQYTASQKNLTEINNIFFTQKDQLTLSVWQLRSDGLNRRLDDIEWSRVLFYLTKHRGYQSNAIEKKRESGKSSDTGKLLTGVAGMHNKFIDFAEQFENPEEHTIGEMIFNIYKNKKRNSTDQYNMTAGRDDILYELKVLFTKQRELGNDHTGEAFYQKIQNTLNSRRSFADGPGGDSPYGGNLIEKMVGKCTLEPTEPRAPKESYASVQFRLYSILNNIRVGVVSERKRSLTVEEKDKAIKKVNSVGKLSYNQLRKAIDLSDPSVFKGLRYDLTFRDIMSIIYKSDEKDKYFYKENIQGRKDIIPQIAAILDRNVPVSMKDRTDQLREEFNIPEKITKKLIEAIKNPEDKTLFDQSNFYNVKKTLLSANIAISEDLLNDTARILTLYRDDRAYKELISLGIPSETAEPLALKPLKQFIHLSVKAINKILPHLKSGLHYDEACRLEGYNHTQSKIDRSNIANPSVFRSFKQFQKLYRTIAREYGKPQQLVLEVARDLSKSEDERRKLDKEMGTNETRRRIDLEHFKSEIGRDPMGREAEVWRLYKEQKGKCLYCGNPLGDLNEIFHTPGAPIAEIEHTLPYSRSLDNRQCNKTVACTNCNREKGNQIPFEYMGSDESSIRWQHFTALCKSLNNKQKEDLLLTTDWDENGTMERQLNDTRYITRVVQDWLEKEYGFVATADKDQKRDLFAVKGHATSVLRKVWGVERAKYDENHMRDSEKNHALDAAVVVAATNRQVQLISKSNRENWLYSKTEIELPDQTLQKHEYKISKRIQSLLPPPWETFSLELLALLKKSSTDIEDALGNIPGTLEKYKIDENPIEPMFISWMPKRGVKGAIHKETIYKVREISNPDMENGKERIYLKKIDLKDLKLVKLEKMAGRFDSQNPNEETPLYLALKKQLILFNDDGKKAFLEPFYKPSKKNAPIVKSIRTREVVGGGVEIQSGAAENGRMVRIDIFKRTDKKGKHKFFIVPVYTKDRVKKELPLKAITAQKYENEWDVVEEREFYCSLYPNDYFQVEKKKETQEGYYVMTNRATGQITIHSHERRNDLNVTLKVGVLCFAKYHVDMLGNRFLVKLPEKRVKLSKPGQNG